LAKTKIEGCTTISSTTNIVSKITTQITEQIFNSDPFQEIVEFGKGSGVQNDVHIRVFKRNGRKCMTTLELTALPTITADNKAFMTKCSKKFCVGASFDKEENVIKFSGDVRDGLAEILIADKLAEKDKIKVHGF